MILFTPDGREITRLPGEVDADQYMRVLAMGMNGARPVKETLAAALAADATKARQALTPEDWRMLAYYSWITDDGELLPEGARRAHARAARAGVPRRPARDRRAPRAPGARRRGDREGRQAAQSTRQRGRPRPQVTSDPASTRENFDLLTYNAGKIAAAVTLPKSAERAAARRRRGTRALDRFAADASLSTADRLDRAGRDASTSRSSTPARRRCRPRCSSAVRDDVARADRETTDVYARQAVISNAAEVLAEAGMLDESDALLTRGAHALAFAVLLHAGPRREREEARRQGGARSTGTPKAWTRPQAPATRLQWGASYVNALVELAPQDSARIERVAARVIGELDARPGHVLRPQPAGAGAHRQAARGLEQERQPQRRAAAARGTDGQRVREAARRRPRARDLRRRAAARRSARCLILATTRPATRHLTRGPP